MGCREKCDFNMAAHLYTYSGYLEYRLNMQMFIAVAKNNNIETVKHLLEMGGSVNASDALVQFILILKIEMKCCHLFSK